MKVWKDGDIIRMTVYEDNETMVSYAGGNNYCGTESKGER